MTNSHPEAEGEPPDDLGRSKLTISRRVELLERDRAQQSRMITEIVGKVQRGFSDEQLAQIRGAFRDELANAGLRLDNGQSQDAAREDFRFLRRFRLAWDGATTKVGNAVLVAAIVILGVIVTTGFWAWIKSGGKGG